MGHSRRSFLVGAAAVGAVATLPGWSSATTRRPPPIIPPAGLPSGLFTLGVASGDPRPRRVVIWTRLAPSPLEGGGMPEVYVPVRWEVATDEAFGNVVRWGDFFAKVADAHSVHVDVDGLQPGSWYFYRFIVGDEVSPVGRARTAPRKRDENPTARFLIASCQNWQSGFWPLWDHAQDEDLDLVLHLGDYIYEGGPSATAVRQHNSTEIRDLAAYRNRYGLYKGDPAIQGAHAACPWIITWDDHEVENNYAGLQAENPLEVPDFAARRAAAYKAWWEHMPVRMAAPTGPDLRIHRRLDWGRLARFHVIDTRQYRAPQACSGDLGPTCPDRTATGRTILGLGQEYFLAKGLLESEATWDVIANQVVMTSMPFAGALYNTDQWDGYVDARRRLLGQFTSARTENAIVLTGDIHAAGAADLVDERPDGTPDTVARGTELVGGSISSMFPADLADAAETLIRALPHVKYADTHQRGYMVCDANRERVETRYRVVESVAVPSSPISTAGTFTTVAGTPGVQV